MFPIKEDDSPFIIAEVGQNHQGRVDIALQYVEEFARQGASAIKFQMRNNKHLFDQEAYNNIYNSSNSFGKTYGDHREALELSFEDMKLIRDVCQKLKVKFIVTPFDELSLDRVVELQVDAIKVASFDLGNIPFLEQIKSKNIPVILSTGGGNKSHVIDSIDLFKSFKDKFAVLHCVSKYPCQASDLSLDKIKKLVEIVDDNAVGLSDHFNGILTGPLGYMLGARVFEKHVTFDRSQKGSDHSFSLEPKGFSNFCRDINRVRDMCKINENNLGEEPVFQRLGKSLTLRFDCEKGQILDASHLSGKIFNDPGIPVREANSVIGKRLTRNMKSGSKILTGDIEKTI